MSEPKTKTVDRAAMRNMIRANKGFSRQTRNREFPNYQPRENLGGGMNRNYERAAQAEAEQAMTKIVKNTEYGNLDSNSDVTVS